MAAQPIRYDDALETPIENEEQVHRDLIDTMRSITETTSGDYGHAVRSVHAKSHGLIEAELVIDENLPPELAQGLFAAPGRHKVVLRISTNPGDILDDAVSAPRGLAVKIFDVDGARLPESEGETTQNLVLANAPAFAAPDAKAFLGSLKQLAATTDKAPLGKQILSAVLRGIETTLETVGAESAMLKTMGGTPVTHPLGDSYYSQTPFRYGDYVAKFAVVPVSKNLTDLTGTKVGVQGNPDALRHVVSDEMIEQGGTWELRVQLNTDPDAMPIEDASKPWPEDASPYRTVGRIVAKPQLSWSQERSQAVDEQMYFSPWHGLAAHRPLGSINRSRRGAYEMSKDYRGQFNGCPIHEPASADALSG